MLKSVVTLEFVFSLWSMGRKTGYLEKIYASIIRYRLGNQHFWHLKSSSQGPSFGRIVICHESQILFEVSHISNFILYNKEYICSH